jgi:hypothetical protein
MVCCLLMAILSLGSPVVSLVILGDGTQPA